MKKSILTLAVIAFVSGASATGGELRSEGRSGYHFIPDQKKETTAVVHSIENKDVPAIASHPGGKGRKPRKQPGKKTLGFRSTTNKGVPAIASHRPVPQGRSGYVIG